MISLALFTYENKQFDQKCIKNSNHVTDALLYEKVLICFYIFNDTNSNVMFIMNL